ncbi:MAG: ribonuclease P protein component [Candidatus Vogelbacteria bacterium]|nr:ribonuclease P protein component [Candidatus Vogelbacteria bacterium]
MAQLGRLSRELITQVLSQGVSVRSPYFLVKIAKLNQLLPNTTGLAVIVPAKVFKQAVVRNRVKRQIRGCLIKLKSKLKPGYGTVFFGQVGIIKVSPSVLFKEITKALHDLITL